MTSRLGPFGLCGLLGMLVSCTQESPPERIRQETRVPSGYGAEQAPESYAAELPAAAKHRSAAYRFQANTDSFAARTENDFHRAADIAPTPPWMESPEKTMPFSVITLMA